METDSAHPTNWVAFLLIAGFVIVVAGLVAYLVFNKGGSNPNSNQSTTNQVIGLSSGQVVITKDGFSPITIQIKKGDSVTWTNKDSSIHQVAADPYPSHSSLPPLDSGPLNANDSYNFPFEKSGTYTYHDEINPLKLKGTVIVK